MKVSVIQYILYIHATAKGEKESNILINLCQTRPAYADSKWLKLKQAFHRINKQHQQDEGRLLQLLGHLSPLSTNPPLPYHFSATSPLTGRSRQSRSMSPVLTQEMQGAGLTDSRSAEASPLHRFLWQLRTFMARLPGVKSPGERAHVAQG